MSLILAVIMTAGGLAPPAVCHAHGASGRAAHDHDSSVASEQSVDEEPGHCHDGLPGHRHHYDDAVAESEPVIAADNDLWHVHFCWFGFDVTLPERQDPTRPRQDEPQTKMVVMQPWHQAVPIVQADQGAVRFSSPPQQAAVVASVAIEEPLVCPCAPGQFRALCDRARLERSGVLRC